MVWRLWGFIFESVDDPVSFYHNCLPNLQPMVRSIRPVSPVDAPPSRRVSVSQPRLGLLALERDDVRSITRMMMMMVLGASSQ